VADEARRDTLILTTMRLLDVKSHYIVTMGQIGDGRRTLEPTVGRTGGGKRGMVGGKCYRRRRRSIRAPIPPSMAADGSGTAATVPAVATTVFGVFVTVG
jgi:hypothetical protein